MRNMLFAVALAISATPVVAQGMDAQEFVTKAATSGLSEVQSSELALDRADQEDVRAFAQMMIADHTAANKELETLARAAGQTVPTQPDGEAAKLLADVREANDDGFEVTYVKDQVAGHESTIALFEGYADGGNNAALTEFARKTLPTLNMHYEKAQALSN